MYNKLILTDCDGVLLDWEYAFNVWMNDKGYNLVDSMSYNVSKRYNISVADAASYVKIFNESATMGFLPPLRDAMHYVRKIHEEYGYIFRVITSMSTDPWAVELRKRNLTKLFGTAIEQVICLKTGSDKDEALAPYKDSGMLWIEDKYQNAEVGEKLGLSSIIVEHGHNMNYTGMNIPIVKNWKEIYEMVKY
jgi:hypothetical protein